MNIFIVVAPFYREITDGLLSGALEFLAQKKIAVPQHQIVEAAGAYEIPLLCKKIALTQKADAVIALGCVIQGETAHFEHISAAVAQGLMTATLDTGVPISFGVLTTYTTDQARARSAPGPENKGREAAHAAWKSATTLWELGSF